MLSVSTDSVQFYPTRFQPATVVPGHSQTLTVAFLPRTLGEAMATLLLHTSHGGFLLQLRGEGVRSQYGLTPVRGAKVRLSQRRSSWHAACHSQRRAEQPPLTRGLPLLAPVGRVSSGGSSGDSSAPAVVCHTRGSV